MRCETAGPDTARRFLPALALAALPLLGACDGGEERTGRPSPEAAREARQSLAPVVAARLDSGNASYRDGNYRRALEHYRKATEYQPEAAAPWFGRFMAHRALGDSAAADSALERARELSPQASLIHPEPGETPPSAPDTAGG